MIDKTTRRGLFGRAAAIAAALVGSRFLKEEVPKKPRPKKLREVPTIVHTGNGKETIYSSLIVIEEEPYSD